MDKRNYRTLDYATFSYAPDARNYRNVLYTELDASNSYMPPTTQKNPPAPPRDTFRDKIGALEIIVNEMLDMKVFDDEDGARLSIEYFNTLSDQDRAIIISDLNPSAFKLRQHYNHLAPLLSEVQHAISKFDDIVIANRLMDLGLDETYSRLFVSNIKNHPPTEEYQLRQISKIPDDVFSKHVAEIISSIWAHSASESELSEKFNISKEQLRCTTNVGRTILNALARGDMTKESMRERYSAKLSPAKFESLSNAILVNQERWYDSLLFSNSQDSSYSVDHVVKQNEAMVSLLGEILSTVKSQISQRRS